MFIRQKAYENAIQKIRVDFGTLIGEEKDEDAYVVLKELPTMEMIELSSAHDKGTAELMEFFHKVLPLIIVDHNLYETEKEKMTAQAVTDFIYEKVDVTSKVVSEYASSAFFTRQRATDEK